MSDRKLALITGSRITLDGDGDDLKLTIRAHRKKKTGAYECYSIELAIGR